VRFTPWIAAGVVALMTVVVLSYQQVVRAYPSGGGSYEVVSTNLGENAGLVVGATLLVDYVMTVAVSVASGVANIISAVPQLHAQRVPMAVGFVALLAVVNLLRGTRVRTGLRSAHVPFRQRCAHHDRHRALPVPARGRAGRRERLVRHPAASGRRAVGRCRTGAAGGRGAGGPEPAATGAHRASRPR
jgi:hypothetical protein